MAEGRIRIGILCEGLTLQRWQAECLRHLQEVPGVELAFLVMPAQGGARPLPGRLRRYPWSTALYRNYRRRWFKPAAMQPVDLAPQLGHLPCLRCATVPQGQGERFGSADLERIARAAPDVLLRFGFNILKGEILELPRFGVWSFHHGDELKYRGGPPGFWEIMDGDPVTGAVLQRLTPKLDGGKILRKGWFGTIDHSLRETVDTVLGHSAIWPAQLCREILAGNPGAAEGSPSSTAAPVRKYPRNGEFLRFLRRQAANKMRFHRGELNRHEEWNIGVLHQPIHTFLHQESNFMVNWLSPPASNQFRADPFGYWLNGKLNVLYERYDRETGQGRISRLRPKADNNLKRSRTMLDTGKHLSYPFVLEHEGQVYVVPEQAAEGAVDLYVLNAENDGLERVARLLDEPLLDPSLVFHDGHWWLFGTKAPLTNVELFLYFSTALTGPYRPHPLNPVKADIRSARPGGTPFVHDGALYRPAQDSSLTYGGRISLNRVTALSPTAFREETVKHVAPMPGRWSQGFHTLSAAGGATLVDGKRFILAPAQRKQARQRKITRLLQAIGLRPRNGNGAR